MERAVDVLVIGGGPAGLAAATVLAGAGAGLRVEVLDREPTAGGTPRHCQHTGFGLRDLHRLLTGPGYARRRAAMAERAGALVRPSATATGWSGPLSIDVTTPGGLERISARAVLLATGARERPRSARLVPGSRPAGVYTTGWLQQAVYLHGQRVGERAVIVGAEHVSYSAALTLRHAGTRVAAMITAEPRHQTNPLLDLAVRARHRFPLLTGARLAGIHGRPRVAAVTVRLADGTERRIACDTVVFTADWIPDHELARRAELAMDDASRAPLVDAGGRTSVPGVYAAGCLAHPVTSADTAARGGMAVAATMLTDLTDPAIANAATRSPTP